MTKCSARPIRAAIVKVTKFIDATPAAMAMNLNGTGVKLLAMMIQTRLIKVYGEAYGPVAERLDQLPVADESPSDSPPR